MPNVEPLADALLVRGPGIGAAIEHQDRRHGRGEGVAQPGDESPLGSGVGAAGDAMKQIVAVDEQDVDTFKRLGRCHANMMHVFNLLKLLIIALVLAGCGSVRPSPTVVPTPTVAPLPTATPQPPDADRYVFTVALSNNSNVPARLVVADFVDDFTPPGAPSGLVTPDVVGPFNDKNVTVTVPGSKPWGLWVLDAYSIERPVWTSEKMGNCRGTQLPIVVSVSQAGGTIDPPSPLC